MSDLQDLIHRNAQLAYDQGVERERERIIKLLETFIDENPINAAEEHTIRAIQYLLSFIKGEQK